MSHLEPIARAQPPVRLRLPEIVEPSLPAAWLVRHAFLLTVATFATLVLLGLTVTWLVRLDVSVPAVGVLRADDEGWLVELQIAAREPAEPALGLPVTLDVPAVAAFGLAGEVVALDRDGGPSQEGTRLVARLLAPAEALPPDLHAGLAVEARVVVGSSRALPFLWRRLRPAKTP